MKVFLPWLVRWACGAGTKDFLSPLASLVQNILFLPVNYFNVFVPFGAASRAGLPVSMYVSRGVTS